MTTIEDRNIDAATITIDFFIDDGVLQHIDSPLSTFRHFAEENNFLKWSHAMFKQEEHIDDAYGEMSFENYCSDHVTDEDLVKFVEAQLKLT